MNETTQYHQIMIDYRILSHSVEYYTANGFIQIETPWTITKEVSDITAPENAPQLTIKEKNKVLVASGEQSFLYLMVKSYLPPGKYQTITPCFRDDCYDLHHSKQFLKNELIITDKVNIDNLNSMVQTAFEFFSIYSSTTTIITYKDANNISYDIIVGDVEVGSYGIRKYNRFSWIYGTGVAEPRFSSILKWKHSKI